VAAVFAGPAGVVVPEIEHGLAEVLDNIAAVEIDVFDEAVAFIAVKDDVLMLAWRPPAFHDDANGIRRADRRVRNVGRDKECFSFPDEMIDNPVAFPDPHLDVALQLVKIFFGIDQMKVVPRIRALDDHDEKVAAVVKITVADRWLEQLPVRFDPVVNVNRRQDFGRRSGADFFRRRKSGSCDARAYFGGPVTSTIPLLSTSLEFAVILNLSKDPVELRAV
jgi:hypothetical protein